MPKRIQRKRTKGWRKPEGVVDVTRGTRWGNHYKVGDDGEAKQCVEKFYKSLFPYTHKDGTFSDYMVSEANIRAIQEELGGKDLMCWCPEHEEGKPITCHADLLLQVANEWPPVDKVCSIKRGDK